MHYFNVLIVDDEEDFLETLTKRLNKRQVDATGAASGEEALEKLRQKMYDVIILDVKMPGGMDGIETLQEIKKIQPSAEVILLTGHASVETSVEGLKSGAFDYLLKPIKLDDLLKKVAQAIQKKDAIDQKNRSEQIKKLLKYW